jgi:outer membrane protein OmpA-like peptidoglycan-associated protein
MRRIVALLSLALLAAPNVVAAQGLPSPDSLDEPAEETTDTATPAGEGEDTGDSGAAEEDTSDTAPVDETGGDAQAESPDPAAASSSTDADESADMATTPAPESEDEGDPRLVAPQVNLEGSVGLQHMAAAYGGRANTYHLALMGEFSSGNGVIRFNDENTYFAGNLLFEATPIEYFSANVRLRTTNNVNTFGRPEAMLSQGDLTVGLKGNYPVSPGIWIGGDLTTYMPADFGTSGIGFSGTSVRPRLLFSTRMSEFTDGAVALGAHVNVGYRVDNSSNLLPDGFTPTRIERFAYDLSAYDMVEFGLGFDYELPYVTPFLAWNLGIPVNAEDGICNDPALPCASDAGFGAFPNVLSLGLKSEPIDHLGIHAGVDIGLTSDDAAGLPVTLPYNVILGLSWEIDPTPPVVYVEKEVEAPAEAPPEGVVMGTVVNMETGEPVEGAIIRYPISGDTPQATTPNGLFTTYGFAPGDELALTIEHPDYEPAEYKTRIEEGETEARIELKPIPKQALVGGLVENAEGNPVPEATIKMTGPETVTATPGPDGRFSREVQPGNYTVAVTAPGYLTRGKDVQVGANAKIELQFVLKPEPKEKLVKLREDKIEIQQKVYFDTGKATILPRSYNLLDQVVSIIIENPSIRIQVEGHTDDVGSAEANLELSQQRAEAVKAYLVEQGISPDRLIAKGFGQSRSILPNTNSRNRSYNRRVEFKRLDTGGAGAE